MKKMDTRWLTLWDKGGYVNFRDIDPCAKPEEFQPVGELEAGENQVLSAMGSAENIVTEVVPC
jgi:hypothetical protein